MVPNLLILGQISIDHVVPATPGPWFERLGGNALYAAAGARLWHEPSRIGVVARRGQNLPVSLNATMEAAGLTTAGLVEVSADNMVEWLIYETDGSRRNLPRAPVLRDTSVDAATRDARYIAHKQAISASHQDIPPSWLPAKGIHLAPQVGDRHASAINVLARRTEWLSVDPSPSYSRSLSAQDLGERLRGAHILMPSQGEVAHLAPNGDWHGAAQQLHRTGFPEVVIKLGECGVVVQAEGVAPLDVPAVQAAPLDLTGAGDAFCGAFLACRVQGLEPLQAARRAVVAAAMIIECAGIDAALGLDPSRAAWRLAQEFGCRA
jgi:sugar/nucleoside kinase (ribokinase family)